MSTQEKELLHYVNNLHYKSSKVIYIHLNISKEYKNFYEVVIFWNEFNNKKTIYIGKGEIIQRKRDNKLKSLLSQK
jgi:hypothetical protein